LVNIRNRLETLRKVSAVKSPHRNNGATR